MTVTGDARRPFLLTDEEKAALAALEATAEYQAAGVIEREQMMFAAIPSIEAKYKQASASHLMDTVYSDVSGD